jgi:Fungal protein kinase
MKKEVEGELNGNTYHVQLTNKILRADSGIVDAVVNSLKATFQTLTSAGHSTPFDPRIPENGFHKEPESYEPLAHLLNKIIITANEYIPQSHSSPLRGLHFQPFEGEVEDKYGSYKGLKPDVIGTTIGELSTEAKEHAENLAKGPPLYWEQIEIPVESKATIRDMVRQSGTYARWCLSSNRGRFFSLVIGFQHKNLEAYVFLFHRSGLSSSRPLKIKTQDGFNHFVKHIVGILSLKDKAAYGLDPTRTKDIFCINNHHYKIVRLLYERTSLRGRSTIVYSLEGMYTCAF